MFSIISYWFYKLQFFVLFFSNKLSKYDGALFRYDFKIENGRE